METRTGAGLDLKERCQSMAGPGSQPLRTDYRALRSDRFTRYGPSIGWCPSVSGMTP
jgi:hypothetical protein